MIYFTTKYALSSGKIQEQDCNPPEGTETYIYAIGSVWGQQFVLGRDAFSDFFDAVTAANAARDKKIASLKKQIAKLEKMRFDT